MYTHVSLLGEQLSTNLDVSFPTHVAKLDGMPNNDPAI